MTAGKLNLTTISGGATEIDLMNVGLDQDNPKFSFFNTVYRRHTNFSMDSRELQQVKGGGFGDNFKFRFTEEGDLVGDSYLEFVLPAVTDCFEDNSQPTTYANWVNAVGFAIINEIQLQIKNVIVDNQDGTYLNILNELTDPHRKLWPLVGKVDDPTKLKFFQTQPTKYIVPLSFSFSKFTGLAYPRFLPNKDSQFEIILTLRNLNNIILHDGGTLKGSPPNISGVKIISTYYTLEDYERIRIKKLQNYRRDGKPKSGEEAGHLIQLIETVQKNSEENKSSITLSGINGNIKEILWVLQPPGRTSNSDSNLIRDNFALDRVTGNDHINYAGTSLTNNAADPFTSLEIDVGGSFTFQSRPASHYRQYLPYKNHSNVPQSYVYCLPLCINPEDYQPSGTYNMGITGKSITFNFSGVSSGYNIKMYVVAYKYLKISTRDVTIDKDIIKDALNRDSIYDLPTLGSAIDIYADESSSTGVKSVVSRGGRSGTGSREIPDDVVNNIAKTFNEHIIQTNSRFLTLQEIISNVQANMNTLNRSLSLMQQDIRRLSQSQGGSQLSDITARSAAAEANIRIARVNKSRIN